jgi:hypothetical protein
MKKFLILLPLLLLAVSAYAGRFAANEATTTPYYWEEVGTLNTLDSVVATDSSFLFKKFTLQRGCGYALRTACSVNVDTITVMVQVFNSSGTFIGEAVVDTINSNGAVTTQHILSQVPVGYQIIGNKFSIVARSWIAGKVAKIRNASLWRYRQISTDLPWNVEP